MELTARGYMPVDAPDLFDVTRAAILVGARSKYALAACEAWAARFPSSDALAAKLADQDVAVGLLGGRILGFMSRAGQMIDFAFVHPDAMGCGLADTLYARLVNRALVVGISRLEVRASLLARSFFLRHGWTVEADQTVKLSDQTLENFRMSVALDGTIR